MNRPIARRGTFVLAAAAALIVAALAAVPAAQASTLYACVSKSGTAHVYTKKPKKCKSKKEKLVSWNTVGPAGKNGANGTNGANGKDGANGAVAGYSATQPKGISFTRLESTKGSTLILSKSLPAGSFILGGSVEALVAQAGKNGEGADAIETYFNLGCSLTDTPASGSATTATDEWSGVTSLPAFIIAVANNTLSFNLAVTTTSASTVAITCTNEFNDGSNTSPSSFSEEAVNGVITAIQTSSNS